MVILRLKGLTFIDATGADALAQIIDEMEGRGITVLVKGARPEHGRILATAGALADLDAKDHLFDDLDAAVTHARRHVHRAGTESYSIATAVPALSGTTEGEVGQLRPST